MSDEEFCAFLELFFVNDPWPLSEDLYNVIKSKLNAEAVSRGYTDWVFAYHSLVWAAPSKVG